MEYEIVLADRLDDHWSTSFGGMHLRRGPDGDGTALRGHVADQAALHGVLARARDLGLTLLSVTCIDPDTTTTARHTTQPPR